MSNLSELAQKAVAGSGCGFRKAPFFIMLYSLFVFLCLLRLSAVLPFKSKLFFFFLLFMEHKTYLNTTFHNV